MTNNVSARPESRRSGDQWRAFDSLPREVRFALNEAVVPWCALTALSQFRALQRQGYAPAQAASALALHLRMSDAREIGEFAAAHQRETGRKLPHVAARASIQRYG